MRNTKIASRFRTIDKKWIKWAKGVDRKLTFANTFACVLAFGLLGVLLYLLIYFFVLPQDLPLPHTTAVNWFVIHNHSLFLDYIRFGVFVVVILVTIITGWFITLWKKRK